MTAALHPTTFESNTFRPTLVHDGFADEQPMVHHRPLDPAVYRRRRLMVLAVVLGVLLGVLSFGRQADASPDPVAVAAEVTVIVVEPGDTLWTIARAIQPHGDHRALVDGLDDLVESAVLQPGQRITIPAALLG